ncbi:fimbrial major subunit CsuA/B family protein [Aerophototrophica crusticola]|uniref:Fimbrial major subunit CsuA/B family protein n=1 Tax=Aerophototrophica crusticola TaxID=1709002 RepID=A0A858R7A8_9PROT|nr:fimbrial major subunit CsuA/B family protein [Rhodospirillaceae bacterium B3]
MFKSFATAALLAAATVAAAAPASANTSGNIQLKGSVTQSCTIQVQDLGQSLNLSGGENQKTVGSVTETCNAGQGYRITLASANAGKLRSGNNAIDYQVAYESQSGNLGGQMVIDRATAQFGRKADLKVTIPASAQYIAGEYADTVTVTIAAK